MKTLIIYIALVATAVASQNGTINEDKKRIIMAYLLPWTGSWTLGMNMGPVIIPAIEDVKEKGLLPGYDIEWQWRDSQCSIRGMEMALNMWKVNKDLDVIIGDACSIICNPLSLLASAWNIPMVSFGCTAMSLSDKYTNPTFSRVSGTSLNLLPMYTGLVKTFGWKKVGLVTDTAEVNRLLSEALMAYLGTQGIVTIHYKIQPTIDQDIVNEQALVFLKNIVQSIKRDVRIIITFLYSGDFTNLVSCAKDEGMLNGGFVFVTSENYNYSTPDADGILVTGVSRALVHPEWPEIASKIIKSYDDPAFRQMPGLTPDASIDDVNAYAGMVYDAIMLWAYGVNKTLEQGYAVDDGVRIAGNIFNQTLQGMTGTVAIDQNGDRKTNYMIQLVQNQKLVPLLEWKALESRMEKLYKPDDPDDWSGLFWSGNLTTVPLDSPLCGWKGELCIEKDNNGIIVSSVVCVVILLTAVVMAIVFRKLRFEQQLKEAMTFCIPWNEIELNANLASQVTLKSTTSSHTLKQGAFTETAKARNVVVAIKQLGNGDVSIKDRNVLLELKIMRAMKHENVNSFVGVCLEHPHACILMTYAPKGSLFDVLQDSRMKLTWDFKLSLITDLAQGMRYLHSSPVGHHGHLTSSNCVVNSRWSCKITDYGLTYIKHQAKTDTSEEVPPSKLLWTAPELLRSHEIPSHGTQKGDVYSFGVISQEVVLQDTPYAANNPLLEYEEIVKMVKRQESPPYRPYLDTESCNPQLKDMITKCWNENEEDRPSFSKILTMIRDIGGGKLPSLVDSMITRLESHTKHLEEIVEERSKQLQEEKIKMEILLQDLLPRTVAEKLKNGLPVSPESFDSVTIFFSDIVSFTRISAAGTPMDVVKMLNFMYTLFDDIAAMFDVYKVATIGDAYFVASGVPTKNGDQHAVEICNMAMQLLTGVQKCPIPHLPDETLKMRIGVHSGPCVAGVAGTKMPRYLLFGETVDSASDMEASGGSMRIHISTATKRLLDKTGNFEIEERGNMTIKGLGDVTTYWLNGDA